MDRLRVASRALGERETVYVHVYDTPEEMWDAARSYNGGDYTGSAGLCQAYVDEDGRALIVIVRLVHGLLTPRIVSHEMLHAATALYGSRVGDRPSRRAHLNHHNEPFTHLFSDLFGRLVDRFTV